MTLDISSAIQAKSDQLNAADLTGGPVVVRIEKVRESTGQADKQKQPYEIIISGGLKPWRPCKTMLRLLYGYLEWPGLFGKDVPSWTGRWIELYYDAEVKMEGERVGGIRLSGADIQREVNARLPISRGRKGVFNVRPIKAPSSAPKVPTLEEVLVSAGLTIEALDAHRAKTGKPPVSTLTDNQRAQMAAHYLAHPEQLQEIER